MRSLPRGVGTVDLRVAAVAVDLFELCCSLFVLVRPLCLGRGRGVMGFVVCGVVGSPFPVGEGGPYGQPFTPAIRT